MKESAILLVLVLFLSASVSPQRSEPPLNEAFAGLVGLEFPKHKRETRYGPYPTTPVKQMQERWNKGKSGSITINASLADTPEQMRENREWFLRRSIMPKSSPVTGLGEGAILLSTCTFVNVAFERENVFVSIDYTFRRFCDRPIQDWAVSAPRKEIERATKLAHSLYAEIVRPLTMAPCENDLVNTYTPRPTSEQGRMLEAAFNGNTDVVKSLLTRGVPVSVTDIDGNTPLHLAVRHGCVDTIRTLINSKADMNARNKKGRTPLMIAVDLRVLDAVRILLDAGADPTIEDEHGVNTARIAAYGRSTYTMFPQPEENIVEIRKLLEARGVTPSELFVNRNRTSNR